MNSQFQYAMTYALITLMVLMSLNIFSSEMSQRLFYQGKQRSMIERCQLASAEISALEVMNTSTITSALGQTENGSSSRLLVTDRTGAVLYDSIGESVGSYALLPEILRSLEGNNVFTWHYHDGAMTSRATTPIANYGTIIGCIYISEYDTAQGALIKSLQTTVLRITIILEIALLCFALIFSKVYSRRLQKITGSLRIIQEGNFTHKVELGGKDELSLLGNEFNVLTERLHTSEQKRHRFVSDASHELKTPLASIKLLTDSILQNDMDMDTVREFVGDIGNEADRLIRTTSKLLSLTKVDSREESDSEIIYMAPTIRRVTRMLSPLAKDADISITLDLEEDAPVLILEDDLYQIVFNLMENGIKYNTPGGKLSAALSLRDDTVALIISDSGVGIPEDAVGHIFERFFRVDKARSRATGGSGLGLAIVRTIVNRNRGEIYVESALEKGTTFTVTFPIFDTEVDRE